MYKDLDELKLEFVRNVYEAITKQIQQMDLKISILLSWNGVIAVLFGREVAEIVAGKRFDVWILIMGAAVVLSLGISAVLCYRVLKPRAGSSPDKEGFAGLLYAGDIQDLGKNPVERMGAYMDNLLKMDTHAEVYQQFVKSIVLISGIQLEKNRFFLKALTSTVICFALLLSLMGILWMNKM